MSLVLESKPGGDFKPHVEGIHPAVCVDVIDLGLVETEFQGQRRLVNKVRLFFETEQKNEEGKELHHHQDFHSESASEGQAGGVSKQVAGAPGGAGGEYRPGQAHRGELHVGDLASAEHGRADLRVD